MEALTIVISVIAIGISAMALVASIYSMWFSRCRETDSEELREAYEEVSNQLSEVEKNICDKLDAINKRYSYDLIEIKNCTSAVQRQVEIINLRYKDSPIPQEHMRVTDECEVQNALREHLTSKLAAEPDTDVSLMLVYWLSLDGYARLSLYSVDPNPGGVPFFSTAVSSSIDFDWDHKIDALKNPDVQLDAICALGCRLQDAV